MHCTNGSWHADQPQRIVRGIGSLFDKAMLHITYVEGIAKADGIYSPGQGLLKFNGLCMCAKMKTVTDEW